jgi:DNA-binding FrmR family transcriptional regulator
MQYEFRDGRLYLHRTVEDRAPITARLARIEGQVRGIRQMIGDDRYCGDEIQQANAVTSAMREVAVMIISQHLTAGVQCAVENPDHQAPIDEMLALLRNALKM